MKNVPAPINQGSTLTPLLDSSTDNNSDPLPVAGTEDPRLTLNKVIKLSREHMTFSTVRRKRIPKLSSWEPWVLTTSNKFEILSERAEVELNKNDHAKPSMPSRVIASTMKEGSPQSP